MRTPTEIAKAVGEIANGWRGQRAERQARRHLERADFDQLRDAFRKNGEKGYWQEQLRRTETKLDSEFYWKAVIYVHLGHTNDVFPWLNKSFETREEDEKANGLHHALNGLLFDEYWDSLRGDPQFKKLVSKMRFPGK